MIKNQRGITLIELIIYITIFAVLAMVITQIAGLYSRSSGKSESRAEVVQNLRTAIAQISADLRSATAITAPTAGSSGNTLAVTIGGNPVTYAVSSSVLQRTDTSGTADVTSSAVLVLTTAPIFTHLTNVGAYPSVQIALTIRYASATRPDLQEEDSVQTTVSLRQ